VITSHWDPSEPHTVGPIAGRLAGPDHDRTGAVAEEERGGAVEGVGEVGQLLHPDDEHVPGGPAAHHVGRELDAVAEPGARGGDVQRAAGVAPSRCASSDADDGVWYGWVTVATRIGVDVRRRSAELATASPGGVLGHVGDRLLRRGEAAA
jgi:hypothetical protein